MNVVHCSPNEVEQRISLARQEFQGEKRHVFGQNKISAKKFTETFSRMVTCQRITPQGYLTRRRVPNLLLINPKTIN